MSTPDGYEAPRQPIEKWSTEEYKAHIYWLLAEIDRHQIEHEAIEQVSREACQNAARLINDRYPGKYPSWERPIRLKIVSPDGWGFTTAVVDASTGRPVEGVKRLVWTAEGVHETVCTMTVCAAIDVVVPARVVVEPDDA